MAAAVKAFHAVNGTLIHSPEQALVITGGLLAAGGVIKLSTILHHGGLSEVDLTDHEKREIELLDEQAPPGFWTTTVHQVHAGLLGWKYRDDTSDKAIVPKVWWRHDRLFNLRHRGITATGDPMVDPSARLFDWHDISTPVLSETGDQLV